MRALLRIAPLFAVLVLAAGCGDSNAPELYEVSGKLVWDDGTPVKKTAITFRPTDDSKPPSTATTDEQGNFTLRTARGEVGAVQGTHKVVLSKSAAAGGGMTAKERAMQQYAKKRGGDPSGRGSAQPKAPEDVMPNEYTKSSTTPLQVTVPDDTEAGDLELTVRGGGSSG